MSLTTVVSHTDPIILRDPDPDGWHELHFGARCLLIHADEVARLRAVLTRDVLLVRTGNEMAREVHVLDLPAAVRAAGAECLTVYCTTDEEDDDGPF